MEGDFDDEERSKQLEGLAIYTHGSLATLHGLSMLYHGQRSSTAHAVAHGVGTAYSILSLYVHYKFYEEQGQ